MECVHSLDEEDHEIMCFFFNVNGYSYVKLYSSTFMVFVNMFNFGLLASRFISLIKTFSRSNTWNQQIPKMVFLQGIIFQLCGAQSHI
jgi:hypothetical protein